MKRYIAYTLILSLLSALALSMYAGKRSFDRKAERMKSYSKTVR